MVQLVMCLAIALKGTRFARLRNRRQLHMMTWMVLRVNCSSPDGGAATLLRLCLVGNLCRNFKQGISAPDGTICKSEVEDLKPHGRGRQLFAAVHDICGVTCTCGVAEVVDAGCSNLPALASEPAKASAVDGAWSYADGFRAQ